MPNTAGRMPALPTGDSEIAPPWARAPNANSPKFVIFIRGGTAHAVGMSVPLPTPMMAQYQAMRKSLPADVLLMFRLGDFYEMFFEDAKTASPILNVALTRRNGIPMCGVPYHAAQGYLARLLKAGKRVAIAEQTSEPKPGKLVEREISRILTAGSIDDLTLLDDQRPNYLAAVCRHGKSIGLACVDHTTGEFTIA